MVGSLLIFPWIANYFFKKEKQSEEKATRIFFLSLYLLKKVTQSKIQSFSLYSIPFKCRVNILIDVKPKEEKREGKKKRARKQRYKIDKVFMLRNTFCTLQILFNLISYLFSVRKTLGQVCGRNRLASFSFLLQREKYRRNEKIKDENEKEVEKKLYQKRILHCWLRESEWDLFGSSFFYCLRWIIYII